MRRNGILTVLCSVAAVLVLSGESIGQARDYDENQQDLTPLSRTEDALGRKDLRRLGLRDVISSTLENNLDIAVERINPQLRDEDITIQKSVFDPTFGFGSRTRGQDVENPRVAPQRGKPLWETDYNIVTINRINTTTMSAELQKRTVTGADVSLTWDYTRQNLYSPSQTLTFDPTTGTVRSAMNPQYATDLVFSVTQPLLKGAGIDYNRRGIKIAFMNARGSRDLFLWEVMGRVLEVQENYWGFVSRIRQLGIERESLRRAKRLLADNRARLKVGQMARADVIEAEAQVAEQQKRIVAAEYDMLIAENQLKKTMNDPDLSVLTEIAIVPVDQPTSDPKEIDWVYCVDKALNLRPDFSAIKAQLEANKIDVKRRKNELYPEIDLEASLTLNGLGETFQQSSDVMSPFHSHNFFDAFIGVKVTMPLGGNRAAKASYRQAQLTAAQSLRSLKNSELEIIRQVREAVHYVQNYLHVIDAAKTVRELRARQLEAKEIKRKAGTGIPFEVVQAQEDLVQAEGAELNALIDYNIWLARLSYRMGTILNELGVEIEEKPEEK